MCIESPPMRRWFALVLLCLFSLQTSWAVAAAYCQHEQAWGEAAHFGHHTHDHGDEEALANDASSDTSINADHDCHACHACPACLPQAAVSVIARPGDGLRPPMPDRPLPAPPPAVVDRPDWLPLA